jgi:hypothetical protein
MARRVLVVSRWWDIVMGWWLRLRGRPRCARSPFEPAVSPAAVHVPQDRDGAN